VSARGDSASSLTLANDSSDDDNIDIAQQWLGVISSDSWDSNGYSKFRRQRRPLPDSSQYVGLDDSSAVMMELVWPAAGSSGRRAPFLEG